MAVFGQEILPLNDDMVGSICRFSDLLPGGFFVYRADEEERLLYANPAMARIFNCESVEEFMAYVGGSFKGIVYAEDYPIVKNSINEQVASNAEQSDYVEYRIRRKDGEIRQIVDYGRLVSTQSMGNVFCVFVEDLDERSRMWETIDQENNTTRQYLHAVRMLGTTYDNVYVANRRAHTIRCLRGETDRLGITEALNSEGSYEKVAAAYIEKNVYFDDKELMIRTLDLDNLCDELKHRRTFKMSYRVFRNKEIHYYAMKAVAESSGPDFDKFFLSFACEDEKVEQENMRKYRGNTGGRRKLLVIANSDADRESLKNMLTAEYDVITAENGSIGLQLMEDNCHALSAVLLDPHVSIMDGYELMERARGDAILSTIPIVIVAEDHDRADEERSLKLGAVEFLIKPYKPSIVFGRLRNIIRMRETAVDRGLIEYEELTGLYTRQAFFHYARRILRDNPDRQYTFFVSDINEFRLINSVYGEAAGDRVLRHVANALVEQTQGMRGILGHYGADRFMGMFETEDFPVEKELESILWEQTRDSVVENIIVKIGLYVNVDHEQKITRICDRAVSALNVIKHDIGRNVGSYDGPLAMWHREERELKVSFPEAIAHRDFEVWFQPKYDPFRNVIIGAEALVRWKRGDGSYIQPDKFVPLFERDGLIPVLDEYIFRRVCEYQRSRVLAGKPLIPISVNMSRMTLFHTETAERYRYSIEEHEIPYSCIPIEITESSALLSNRIGVFTDRLKDAGFTLHMDDFGSGYSSLTSLGILPFDVIKIDKGLTDTIGTSGGKMVLRHMMELIHEMGMRIVVEGVETFSQVEFLKQHGCDSIQGFFYSPPVPRERFEAMLEKQEREMIR